MNEIWHTAQTCSLTAPQTTMSWQPFISVSVPVQHICHLVEVSRTLSMECMCFKCHQMNYNPRPSPAEAHSHKVTVWVTLWNQYSSSQKASMLDHTHSAQRVQTCRNRKATWRWFAKWSVMCSFSLPLLSAFHSSSALCWSSKSFHSTCSKLWQKCTWFTR